MRILVVDDDELKRADVRRCLEAADLDDEVAIHVAVDYEEALARLREGFFELVILDVLLPGGGNGPSRDFSRALIKKITLGADLIPPTNIIALTAFPEVGDDERAFYDEHIFAIETYDANSDVWRDRLVRKIKYLKRAKRAGAEFYRHSFDFDVLVITARYENEFVPVKRKLFREITADQHAMWKTPIALGVMPGPGGRMLRTCLVCASEMGMATTAAVASEAVALFRPRLVSMLGMCCGFDIPEAAVSQQLLNAIVVRDASCWEVGKYEAAVEGTPEFKNRSKARPVDDSLREEIDDIVERKVDTLNRDLERLMANRDMTKLMASPSVQKLLASRAAKQLPRVPDVRFGSLVSGSSVIANRDVIKEIVERHPSALGLDMEVYGLYTAVEKSLGRRPSMVAVKGVADFGDAEKSDVAQRAASTVSTVVFRAIVRHLTMFSGRRRAHGE